MKVSVRLFAGLRERAGAQHIEVELPDGAVVGDLLTAMGSTPVGELRSPEGVTPAPSSTELTMQIREALVGMQFGRAEDTFGWMHRVV